MVMLADPARPGPGLDAAPRPVAPRRSRPWGFAEGSLLAGLLVAALLLRLYRLGDLPRYTDEVLETMSAIDIAQGRILPLVSPSKHIGALFNYLLAGVILVVGKSPDLPRYVTLVIGVATIVLTYGYARRLGGRSAGLAAAGLLAASAPHVLLSSRVAWSSALTPLLILAAAWALDLAVSARRPRLLLATGLLAGLAFQAHPSTLALLPGLALFVLARGRWLFRRPELYLAGALFVVGCANVLLYNWQTGLGTVRSVSQEYPGRAFGPAAYLANPAAYLATVVGPARGIALALASSVDPEQEASLADPFVPFVVGVCLVALLRLARRASALPALVMLSALACFPFLHDDFDPLLKARYTMPLVPLTYVAVGVLVADLWGKTGERRLSVAWRLGAAGIWLALAGGLLGSLFHFQGTLTDAGCTNAPQRALVAEMERNRLPGEWVLLDPGVVRPIERLGYLWLLEWSGRKVGDARLLRNGVFGELDERPSFLTVVNDGKVAMTFEKQGVPLLPSEAALAPDARPVRDDRKAGDGGTGLYRVTAEGATLLAYQPSLGCDRFRAN